MDGDADIARAAALLAEPARAKVLMALADGRALPASLLATEAGVSPQTISSHLHKLLDGGLLEVERSGRHRYYKLAGPEVAEAVEAVARIAKPQPISSLRQSTKAAALREARTCYDHLAGRLGVALLEGLVRRDALERTDGGEGAERRPRTHWPSNSPMARTSWAPRLLTFSATSESTCPRRTPAGNSCASASTGANNDTTWPGRLGEAVTTSFFRRGWLERRPYPRAVALTPAGHQAAERARRVVLEPCTRSSRPAPPSRRRAAGRPPGRPCPAGVR